jgi:uncharacterized membrane protein
MHPAGESALTKRLSAMIFVGVLAVLLGSLLLGVALRSPCLSGDWATGVQYRTFCYTDILPLYQNRGLAEGELPYLQAANEYPVGLGMLMAATARPVDDARSYFRVNVLLLSVCAAATTWLLFGLRGARALYFAAAPTLVLCGFVNWDLFVVALTTAATVAFLRRRDTLAAVLLGVGAASKLYPALLLIPFVWQRLQESERRRAKRLSLAAAATWLLVNVPFAIAAFGRWSEFFRFNAERPPEWASVWSPLCRAWTGDTICREVSTVNTLSTAAFLIGVLILMRAWLPSRRQEGVELWLLGFQLIALFLLTTKVYSPQYSLWLLPWFVLVLPDPRLFVAFEVSDAAVFLTRLSWEGRYLGFGGVPIGALELAVAVRCVVLITMMVRAGRGNVSGALRIDGGRSRNEDRSVAVLVHEPPAVIASDARDQVPLL